MVRRLISLALAGGLALARPLAAQGDAAHPEATHEESAVTTRATGTFDVKLAPLTTYDTSQGTTLGRMSINKQFHGDLEGTSIGEMLIAGTAVKTSAGYVAVERVTATLKGKKGTFILQHSATMNRGAPNLVITVVPDSGTDELTGLSGTMNIIIADGKHSYEFDYSLPSAP
ncbi:MAG TPA: DUF3224 domain-containing protein [Gemmatimonadales bacterium]|nr:DUF3224 domain-containing protein [Gemmatimonadales bacterium]